MSYAYELHEDRLDNELRVVTVELPHLHSGLLAVYVRVGSRHETPETSGVGHFLEHLFFRGSQAFPDSVAMHAAVEEVGGNLNGYTSRDHAVYFTPIFPSGLAIAARVLGDMMAGPLLDRPSELELEREVILEEMLDEVDEDGRDIDLDNLAKQCLWPGHPLAQKIAGTPETVRALGPRELFAHHARYYGGENLILCAAGKVSHGRVMEEALRSFAGLPRGERSTEAPPPAPPKGPAFHLFEHDESQTEFRLSFPAPAEGAPGFLPLSLLRRVLDDGLSSRLPLEIVERRGLCYSVHCSVEGFDDGSLFEVEGAASHGKVAAAVREICRLLGRVAREGVTLEELDRAKRRHRMGLDFTLDSPSELAAWFGGTALFRPPPSFEARADALDAVPLDDVRALAHELLGRERLTVTAVGSPSDAQRKELRRAALDAEGLS